METGATLKENDLVVVEEFEKISARLIANKSSFRFKTDIIEDIKAKLSDEVERKKAEK